MNEKQAELASLSQTETCEEVSRDDATLVAEEVASSRSSLDVSFFVATPSITSCRLFSTTASQFKWCIATSGVNLLERVFSTSGTVCC